MNDLCDIYLMTEASTLEGVDVLFIAWRCLLQLINQVFFLEIESMFFDYWTCPGSQESHVVLRLRCVQRQRF